MRERHALRTRRDVAVPDSHRSHADTLCDLAAAQAPRDEMCARAWMDENLRVNDLLSVGTHNSYKAAIPDAEMTQLRARSTSAATVLDYSHRPSDGRAG